MFRQRIKNEKKFQRVKDCVRERYFDEFERLNGLKSSRKPGDAGADGQDED